MSLNSFKKKNRFFRPLKVGSNLKSFPRRSQTWGNEIYNSWLQNNVHWHSSILSPGSFWLLVSGMVAKSWTLGEWINSIFWLVDRKTIASTLGVRWTEGIDRAGNRTLITINWNFFYGSYCCCSFLVWKFSLVNCLSMHAKKLKWKYLPILRE